MTSSNQLVTNIRSSLFQFDRRPKSRSANGRDEKEPSSDSACAIPEIEQCRHFEIGDLMGGWARGDEGENLVLFWPSVLVTPAPSIHIYRRPEHSPRDTERSVYRDGMLTSGRPSHQVRNLARHQSYLPACSFASGGFDQRTTLPTCQERRRTFRRCPWKQTFCERCCSSSRMELRTTPRVSPFLGDKLPVNMGISN